MFYLGIWVKSGHGAKQFTGRKKKHRKPRPGYKSCQRLDFTDRWWKPIRQSKKLWVYLMPFHSQSFPPLLVKQHGWRSESFLLKIHSSRRSLGAAWCYAGYGLFFLKIWGCTDPVSDPWYKAATTGCGYPCLEDRCSGLAGCVYNVALKCCEALDVLLHEITLDILREDSTRWIVDLWKSLIQIRGR